MPGVTESEQMMQLARQLFPLNRSLTGAGVRSSLQIIQKYVPELSMFETPTGTQVGDWNVPKEWEVKQAYVEDYSTGERVIDFAKNNLHVVGYSTPIDSILTFQELDKHLYSLPNQPEAIPYVTSYYKETWGFCLSHNARILMKDKGPFHVVIDSNLFDGSMTFGEVVLPGREKREVLFSTYICHPSMANNELSGPVIWTFLLRHLQRTDRRFTYRFYIGPETIGAINYIHLRTEELKRVFVGWVLSCIGDAGPFSYLKSRFDDSLSDQIGLCVVQAMSENHKVYSFLDRGSDERQFCAPGIDLPIGSFMRSKYGAFPEYHTSLDDLSLLSAQSLSDSLEMMKLVVNVLENNESPRLATRGEPFMSKYGLYPTTSIKSSGSEVRDLMNVLAYMDGTNDLIEISKLTGIKISWLLDTVKQLKLLGIIS